MVLDFAKEAIQNVESHSINFDELKAGKASIKVIGVGGCGSNMVTWLFNKGINGANIYAANTDALHLSVAKADEKVLIGKELTRGLGAGGKPSRGREAAKESLVELKRAVGNADMVFVLAGIVFLTIYQVTNPKLKKYNKGWLHESSKPNHGGSID